MRTFVEPVSKAHSDDRRQPLLGRTDEVSTGQHGGLHGEAKQPGRSPVWFFCSWLDVRSSEEGWKTCFFMLATFMANGFFVIARNVGVVILMASVPPEGRQENLTLAMFLAGASSFLLGKLLSTMQTKHHVVKVSGWLLIIGIAVLFLLYCGAKANRSSKTQSRFPVIFICIYVAEDTLSNFVILQTATVQQAAFSLQEAKRLFGFVQLGNSIAAMTMGTIIGPFVKRVGDLECLPVQCLVLLITWLLNCVIKRRFFPNASATRKTGKRVLTATKQPTGEWRPWWRNSLVVAMGLWSFMVFFTKTIFEYEYSVLVSRERTPKEMCALTGALYACSGLVSMVVNLVGTNICLKSLGMRGAILLTPAVLLLVSLAITISPGVETSFIGRAADLSLRWSLNNTVRSVLWIAVPQYQAAAAKPWVEGAVKKLGQACCASVFAGVLALAHLFGFASLPVLSVLACAFSVLLLVICMRLHSWYLDSMWLKIKRRELNVQASGDLYQDTDITQYILDRLNNGGTVEQLDMLLQTGEVLSIKEWSKFFENFANYPKLVQVKIIELSRKQRHRVSDEFLLSLLSSLSPDDDAAVLQIACLALSDRKVQGVLLDSALEQLQILMSYPRPSLRAAAAVSILRMGWGVGLGNISSAAVLVLEEMLAFPLTIGRSGSGRTRQVNAQLGGLPGLTHSRALQSILAQRGLYPQERSFEEALSDCEEALTKDWERACVENTDMGNAVVLAMQLTQVKAALGAIRRTRISVSEKTSPTAPLTHHGGASESVSLRRARSPHFSRDKNEETIIALQMMQELPEPRAILDDVSWVELLQHPAVLVRKAALAFVTDRDAAQQLKDIVRCLQASETCALAEVVLRKFVEPSVVLREVRDQLAFSFQQQLERDRHQQKLFTVTYSSASASASRELADTDAKYGSTMEASGEKHMTYLLRYLQRQSRALCGPSSSTALQVAVEEICDELLAYSSEITDADVLQELYQTLMDLKDNFTSDLKRHTREKAEHQIHQVAEKMCQGLVLKQWVQRCCRPGCLSLSQIRVLRRILELPAASAASGAGQEGARMDHDIADVILKIGVGYIDEHIYIQRLQLLELSVLVAPKMPAAYRATRVLAAWKLLRSKDAVSEAAVLEILESMLPAALRKKVLPLIDNTSLEQKLDSCPTARQWTSWEDTTMPPPWMSEWFRSSFSVLGSQFAEILRCIAAAENPGRGLPNIQEGHLYNLMPKLLLLSRVNLYEGLLFLHLAEIAMITQIMYVPCHAPLCQPGTTYIIASGTFYKPYSGQTLDWGDVVQELHAICGQLRATDVVCTSPAGGTVLCVQRENLTALMLRLPPKFALGILKNLVKILEELAPPRQTGGYSLSAAPLSLHPESSLEPSRPALESRDRFCTADLYASPGLYGEDSPLSALRPGPVQMDIRVEAAIEESAVYGKGPDDEDGSSEATRESGLPPEVELAEEEDEEWNSSSEHGADELALLALQHSNEDAACVDDGLHRTSKTMMASDDGNDMTSLDDSVSEGSMRQPSKVDRGFAGDGVGGEEGFVNVPLDSHVKEKPEHYFLLEKLVVIRGVKMFRFIPQEHLPDFAKVCEKRFAAKGEYICHRGDATDEKLYIVKDGSVGLVKVEEANLSSFAASALKSEWPGGRAMITGDTFGNTSLLLNTTWKYSVVALEHTNLLTIDRRRLSDLLRGRGDLAGAVIKGLFKTFTRRMKLVERMKLQKSSYACVLHMG